MVKRYHTQNKESAFGFMQYLNKTKAIVDNGEWRVVARMKNRIIFDIDNEDINNVKKIVVYYTPLFGQLKTFKSFKGYHIYGVKKYTVEYTWHYDCCRVLYPLLETKDLITYLGKVNKWYSDKLKEEFELQWDKTTYIENIKKTFPESGLYCGIGDFDIIFALMVIFKGYYCIRISKKGKDDETKEVII